MAGNDRLLETSVGTVTADTPASLGIVPLVLRGIGRHWWQILAAWLLISGAAAYVIYVKVHPTYEASSLLRVEPSPGELFESRGHNSDLFEPFLKTQVQLITSPNVLTTAVADPHVAALPLVKNAPDAEVQLAKRLEVHIIPDSFLIRVSMISQSTAEATTIVNAVVNAYLAAAAEWSDGMTRAQIKNLEAYQRELQDQVDEKQEAWLTLASKSNLDLTEFPSEKRPGAELPMASRSRMTLDEFKRVRELLFKTNIELLEADALLSMRVAELEATGPDPDLEARRLQEARELFHADPAVAVLLQEMQKAYNRIGVASRVARSRSDPARIAALKRLRALNAHYKTHWALKQKQLIARVRAQDPNDLDRAVHECRSRIESLKASKKGYEKFLAEIEVSNKQEGTDAVRLALVRETLTGLKTMQDAVNRRLEQLRFEAKGDARISRINEARRTAEPIKDSRLKLLVLTPVGVLALLVGLAVIVEMKSGRIAGIEELSRRIPNELYVLPQLPAPQLSLDPSSRSGRSHQSQLIAFLQGLDHIRAALCCHHDSESGRVVLIVSAVSGEGKTTLALQLAACCARAGVATLVIDADLRRASLSQRLSRGDLPGLSNVLKGEACADELLVAIPEEGFQLLPAGKSADQPGRLLHGPRFGRLLSAYRRQFPLILIDSPPMLPVPDALTMGRFADGAILVVRQDKSRFSLVDRARQRILAAEIPILKTVFNDARTSRFASRDSEGYGYGYGDYGYRDAAVRSDRAADVKS